MKKKKIAILGSTGSIGKSSLEIINLNKKILILFYYQPTQIIKKLFNQIKII